MSLTDNNPSQPVKQADSRSEPSAQAVDDRQSAARIAHELANLLDAGMRNLGLVLSNLHATPADPHQSQPQAEEGDSIRRLESVNQAMRQMANMVQNWQDQSQSLRALFHTPQTISQTIEHTVALLSPVAASQQIQIRVNVPDELANLPAGPIYPILANALRNSIEALISDAHRPSQDAHVHLVGRIDAGYIELVIRDTGPGLDEGLTNPHGQFRFGQTTKITGHGIGLTLSRDIAQNLGGTIKLSNDPDRGTVFVLRYPVPKVID